MSSGAQLSPLDMSFFGDGSDGNVTISINSTLTRSMWYNNLTINAGVVLSPDGYKITCKGTLTVNGTIRRNGNNGNNAIDFNSVTGGTQSTSVGKDLGANAGGTASGAGATGAGGNSTGGTVNSTPYAGGVAAAGGNGGAAANPGGLANIIPSYGRFVRFPIGDALLFSGTGTTLAANPIQGGGGGTGGGGGGGSGGGNQGGGGGSGAAGGNVVAIFARNIIISGSGIIEAKGGNGGNGAPGQSGNSGGGGGGGSGGGGFIYLLYLTFNNSGTISVAAGTPGNPGAGLGTGNPGIIGTSGAIGNIVKYNALLGRVE